jgi:phosphatidylserine/phosphatidylglycerophosphate/cardiolipin synthase-like enzyme
VTKDTAGTTAEDLAQPSYKWFGERRFVNNAQGWRISLFIGGIGFSFYHCSDQKGLRIVLYVTREDGVQETYLTDAAYCGEWGGPWQKWQTARLPLFPYESLHGLATNITFSYTVLRDGDVIPSRYRYRFATLDDFHRGWTRQDDFHDPALKSENGQYFIETDDIECREAYERLNDGKRLLHLTPFFTRGDAKRADHPVHAIHMAIDRVIERKAEDPHGSHSIRLAMYDFDNADIAKHLVYARSKGVDIECVGEWTQVSSMNVSENIACLRRASIPVHGVIRNDPSLLGQDISSMHTKIMLFDDDLVHSASCNLHFHLWGGNWENTVAHRSKDASLLYCSVYEAIRHGRRISLDIDPSDRFNLYYSFGTYQGPHGAITSQDVIVSEMAKARESIVVCMFELARLKGRLYGDGRELDAVEALIQARDRGVRVRIIVNGMMSHGGPQPEDWDKAFRRPLKEPMERLRNAWMEVSHVYYWESIYSPLHHKFAVIDSSTVITGSYNWYEPSIYSDEVLMIARDEKLAQAFLEEAELILRSFRIERE